MMRIAAWVGILGGLLWVGLALVRPEWGPPGTAPYWDYELWNRLWTPALVGMASGFAGFFRWLHPMLSRLGRRAFIALLSGFALMVLGNIGEFWLLTDKPYEGEGSAIRLAAWLTYLGGALLVLSAAAVGGSVLWHMVTVPRLLALLAIVALPLSIALMFLNMELAVQVPAVGGLSILTGWCTLRFSNRAAPGIQPQTRLDPS